MKISFLRHDKEQAFKLLYEEYYAPFCLYAKRFIEDKETREDIVSDVFTSLWDKIETFEIDSDTTLGYIKMCVKNSCLNTIRHQGVKDRYAEVALHEEELESFWDHILETELFELLLGVFNELPPACREVYRLSLEGKKHEEIAEILQITVNTVKKHKNNANHYMRERLKHILSLLVLCQFP